MDTKDQKSTDSSWEVEDYDKAWDLAHQRYKHQQPILDYLKKHGEEIGINGAKTFLTLGAGNGDLDHAIIDSCMPKLEVCTVVEPSGRLLSEAKENICKTTTIKAIFVKSRMQDYSHRQSSVDVVLLAHSLYYVSETMESLQHEISRAFEYLAPRGVMIINIQVGDDEEYPNCIKELRTTLTTKATPVDCTAKTIAQALDNLNLPYSETFLPLDILIHPGEGLKEAVQIKLNKVPNQDEVERSVAIMRKYCRSGTDRCQLGQKLFVIKKE